VAPGLVFGIGEPADDIEPVREPVGFGFDFGGQQTVIVRILERIDPAVGIADLPELPVPVDRQFGALSLIASNFHYNISGHNGFCCMSIKFNIKK